MSTLVWAYAKIKELNDETGFVTVDDDELAEKLLKSDQVQDPQVGAFHLKEIGSELPKKPAAKKTTKKSEE